MRYYVVILFFAGLFFCSSVGAQALLKQGSWNAELVRQDGKIIPFRFDITMAGNKPVITLINATDRFVVRQIKVSRDSVWIEMPVFESAFAIRKISNEEWEGSWTKAGSLRKTVMPFRAFFQKDFIPPVLVSSSKNITGKWAIRFPQNEEISRYGIGEWKQNGNLVTGTILTPTGDYRFLSGFVKGDLLQLSTFDGVHAFLFTAVIQNDHTLSNGHFYSGATSDELWVAEKNDQAMMPDVAAMFMKDKDEKLRFRFADLNNKMVSVQDEKFRNKVVVVQIMGSWCPNCMDETAYLSDFYNRYRQKGVEVIALAYEYSTDAERSKKGIEKFKSRFNAGYTFLNTGVTVGDSLRTEKTLPQLTAIKSFPSMIILDKTGRVANIHTGFEGPGTGDHYLAFKKEFEKMIDRLLEK